MSLLKPKKGFFSKLKEFFMGQSISDDLYDNLEELLIQSDIGIKTTTNIIEELSKYKYKESSEIYNKLEEILIEKLNIFNNNSLNIERNKKNILLIVGVNGVGKNYIYR